MVVEEGQRVELLFLLLENLGVLWFFNGLSARNFHGRLLHDDLFGWFGWRGFRLGGLRRLLYRCFSFLISPHLRLFDLGRGFLGGILKFYFTYWTERSLRKVRSQALPMRPRPALTARLQILNFSQPFKTNQTLFHLRRQLQLRWKVDLLASDGQPLDALLQVDADNPQLLLVELDRAGGVLDDLLRVGYVYYGEEQVLAGLLVVDEVLAGAGELVFY